MCFAFFIATGSFFLGQQDVLPAAVRGSPILFVLAFAPFGGDGLLAGAGAVRKAVSQRSFDGAGGATGRCRLASTPSGKLTFSANTRSSHDDRYPGRKRPTLALVPTRCSPDQRLMAGASGIGRAARAIVRGRAGACTGHANAAAGEFLRRPRRAGVRRRPDDRTHQRGGQERPDRKRGTRPPSGGPDGHRRRRANPSAGPDRRPCPCPERRRPAERAAVRSHDRARHAHQGRDRPGPSRAAGRSLDRTALADLWSSGTPATSPGGLGTQFGIPFKPIAGPSGGRAFVRARIAEGSDYIKILYEPSVPLFTTISRETLGAWSRPRMRKAFAPSSTSARSRVPGTRCRSAPTVWPMSSATC